MSTTHTHVTERFFLDAEFIEDGHTIELVSIAVAALDGREFYAENLDARLYRANDWVKTNVIPHLGSNGMHHREIGPALVAFIGASPVNHPEFWAYYADYDWVAVCQLFGRMVDLPEYWPMFCMDLKQLAVSLGDPRLPPQLTFNHHSLFDARWTRDTYLILTEPQSPRSKVW
jgi:hypothetical protein